MILVSGIIFLIIISEEIYYPKKWFETDPSWVYNLDKNTPNISIEKFLSMLRFEQRGKLDDLDYKLDIKSIVVSR